MHAFRKDGEWIEFSGQKLPIVGGVPNDLYIVPIQWSDAEKRDRFGLHVVLETPAPPGKRVASYSLVDDNGEPRKVDIYEVRPLSDLKEAKVEEINAYAAAILAAGAPVDGGLHVALDDGARADMGAMATTALAASAGIPWPSDYALGWITTENVRIPLPTPSVGLAFAANVGAYYAAVKQHCRDLKDAALAAPDAAALDAIDETAGWPV